MRGQTQEDTRDRIIEASIRLFLAKGFAGATTGELTKAAGVSKGSLYWHFSSKDEILEEILSKFSSELFEPAFEAVALCDGNFLKKFKAFYRSVVQSAMKNKELLQLSNTILGEIAGSGSVAERKLRAIHWKVHDFLKRLLEQGQREGAIHNEVDVSIQAHILQANFIGMNLQWCLFGDSFDAASYSRAYRESMLRGLGANAG